jgi:mannose-6-phosphate isomerase-like protein (cupin superfamily)
LIDKFKIEVYNINISKNKIKEVSTLTKFNNDSDYCYIIVREKPKIIELNDDKGIFGIVEEITSRAVGAERANIAKIILWGPDILHTHKETEETYICVKGEGEIFLIDQIFEFIPGVRVIVRPGILHAAKPKKGKLVFLCVSSPAFNPKDVYNDPRGRAW